MSDSNTDERTIKEIEWVKGINEGDQKSFEALYRFYYPRLSQFAFRYVKSKGIAEDLVQNVFYNIWNKRKTLRPTGTLRAYLYTAVRNQAIKHLQLGRTRYRSEVEDITRFESIGRNPEEELSDKEFKDAVVRAVNSLPEKRRHIFLMHREDQLTYREISEVLDISIKTVETQMSRSLKHLRDQLSGFLVTAGVIASSLGLF